MNKNIIVVFAAMFAFSFSAYAAPVKIAAALPDLGSIAAYIGGENVEVFSIAKNTSNPHFVEILPSYMIKVSRSDVYLKCGLALDQWSDGIIDGSRNDKLFAVDCSEGVAALQKPTGKVDASLGDVHSEGNPHYWLDPSNSLIVAGNILSALKKVNPENTSYYDRNFESFKKELQNHLTEWKSKMAQLSGRKIIGYHSSWVYFADAFNLQVAGYVEPLPGIPPTGKHLAELIRLIKKDGISILIQEPYFPDGAPRFLARNTEIKVFKIAPSCNDVKPDSYFEHFDEIIDQITK